MRQDAVLDTAQCQRGSPHHRRKPGHQRLRHRPVLQPQSADDAYTASRPYAGFEEDDAGTLETGKRADFVVLSDDPRTVDPAALRTIWVLATVIGGETVFRRRPCRPASCKRSTTTTSGRRSSSIL